MTAPALPSPANTRSRDQSRNGSYARRLLRKILIVLAVVVFLIVATIQIVLWTNLPRRIVLSVIQEQLGLRVTAKSLSTGWLGRTALSDVTLALPLADKPFLELPELDVRHTWLPGILLNRPFAIYSLDLIGPKIAIRQSAAGRWNLQEAANLAAGTLASSANSSTAATLPEVHVHQASLSLLDNKGRHLEVDPVQVDCKADSAVSWKFHVAAQDRVDIVGRIAPAAQWQHRLTITGQNLSDWLHPWAPQLPSDVDLNVEWTGQIASNALTGNLDIAQLRVGSASASGRLAATLKQTSPAVLIEPKNLVLSAATSRVGALQFLNGAITFDGQTFSTDSIDVAAFGGPINLKGWVTPANQIGELRAAWRQLALPGNITHDGAATIHLSRPFVTLLVADVKIDSAGQTPRGSWASEMTLSAQGSDWLNFDWQLQAPKVQWVTAHETKKLDGLLARGKLRQPSSTVQPRLSLDSLSSPSDPLASGQGFYNFADRSWKLHMGGARWPLHPVEDVEFGYALDAGGDAHQSQLHKLSLTSGLLKLDVAGTYRYGLPRPVVASLSLNNAGEEQSAPSTSFIAGQLAGDVGLEGTLLPLKLSMSGRVAGTDVSFQNRPIGDLNLVFDGNIDADKIDAQTKALRFLGGDWDLRLLHSQATDQSDLKVRIHNVALADVGDLIGSTPMGGRLSGEWTLVAPTLRFNINQMKLTGDCVASGGVFYGPRIAADEVRFTTDFENGMLRLAPINFQRGDYGRGNAHVSWRPSAPLHIDGGCSLSAWPIQLPEQELSGNVWLGLGQVAVDLPDAKNSDPGLRQPRFNAPLIDLRVNVEHDGAPLGDLHAVGRTTDRVLDFKQLQGTVLGGAIDGNGHFDLDKPQTSQAHIAWSHLDSRKLTIWMPESSGLTGEMSGSATLAAATSPRALGPMMFTIQNKWVNGAFRTLPLIDAAIYGYADFAAEKEARGDRSLRVVLDDDPDRRSAVHLGQGTAKLWGRLSRHLDNSLAVQAQVTFAELSLDQLLKAAAPSANATAGKVAGTFMFLFDTSAVPQHTPSDDITADATTQPETQPGAYGTRGFSEFLDRIYCEGNAQLSDANLANIGFVSVLYNTLNVFQKANQPTGTGTLQFRVERSTLRIPAMRYFNKGTEVRAQLAFPKVWDMPNSPIRGTAVGVAVPLAALKLPFLQDLDSAFSSLQSSLLTSVAISGNVAPSPIVTPLLFKNIGTDFQRFFKSDYGDSKPEFEGQ